MQAPNGTVDLYAATPLPRSYRFASGITNSCSTLRSANKRRAPEPSACIPFPIVDAAQCNKEKYCTPIRYGRPQAVKANDDINNGALKENNAGWGSRKGLLPPRKLRRGNLLELAVPKTSINCSDQTSGRDIEGLQLPCSNAAKKSTKKTCTPEIRRGKNRQASCNSYSAGLRNLEEDCRLQQKEQTELRVLASFPNFAFELDATQEATPKARSTVAWCATADSCSPASFATPLSRPSANELPSCLSSSANRNQSIDRNYCEKESRSATVSGVTLGEKTPFEIRSVGTDGSSRRNKSRERVFSNESNVFPGKIFLQTPLCYDYKGSLSRGTNHRSFTPVQTNGAAANFRQAVSLPNIRQAKQYNKETTIQQTQLSWPQLPPPAITPYSKYSYDDYTATFPQEGKAWIQSGLATPNCAPRLKSFPLMTDNPGEKGQRKISLLPTTETEIEQDLEKIPYESPNAPLTSPPTRSRSKQYDNCNYTSPFPMSQTSHNCASLTIFPDLECTPSASAELECTPPITASRGGFYGCEEVDEETQLATPPAPRRARRHARRLSLPDAIQRRDFPSIKIALQAGDDPNDFITDTCPPISDSGGAAENLCSNTTVTFPILLAAELCDAMTPSIFEALLEAGAIPNAVNERGENAIKILCDTFFTTSENGSAASECEPQGSLVRPALSLTFDHLKPEFQTNSNENAANGFSESSPDVSLFHNTSIAWIDDETDGDTVIVPSVPSDEANPIQSRSQTSLGQKGWLNGTEESIDRISPVEKEHVPTGIALLKLKPREINDNPGANPNPAPQLSDPGPAPQFSHPPSPETAYGGHSGFQVMAQENYAERKNQITDDIWGDIRKKAFRQSLQLLVKAGCHTRHFSEPYSSLIGAVLADNDFTHESFRSLFNKHSKNARLPGLMEFACKF